jgi:hypothetical protein
MADSRIKDVSSLLSAFFDEEKLSRGGQYADFFGSWKHSAGDRLSAHSRIVDICNNLLIVEADHPGWIQLLQLRQAEILRLISQRFPQLELRGISFRLGRTAPANGEPSRFADTKQRMGPFGPEAKHDETECESQESDTGHIEITRSKEDRRSDIPLSLDDIEDPNLRDLLAKLKKTVDDGRG